MNFEISNQTMSLNVVSSEPCPYHEDGHNSKVECDCTVGIDTSLDHHVEFVGSYKRAFYGLVGAQVDVNLVHQKMAMTENQDQIYTLIMNCDNNEKTIMEEINLFKEIEKADPSGNFTPLLIHHNRIYKNSPDSKALQKICANVKAYQDVKYKSARIDKKSREDAKMRAIRARKNAGLTRVHYNSDSEEEKEEGQELVDIIESNKNSLFFMYVTDAGISSYDYVAENCNKADVNATINATQNLAENYQRLAMNGIGHYDLHGNNIMCKKRDGKLCLSIIDFGFGFAIENGIQRNVLHFLFSGVSFDNAEKTQTAIRYCDPVHYTMFVMCFGMLRRTLNQAKGADLNTVHMIINEMRNSAFSHVVSTPSTQDMQNFQVLEENVVTSYKDFYDKSKLQGIWKRVCEKTYVVVSRFLRRENGMQELSARTRKNDPNGKLPSSEMYVADNAYTYASRATNVFTILFDEFSMAFYDRDNEPCDQLFLRKKFDEYSIANVCVFLLKKFMHANKTDDLRFLYRNECMKLQNKFSAPHFFLRNDQHEQMPQVVPNAFDSVVFPERDTPITPVCDEPNNEQRKRRFACTPGPAMISYGSTPAAKRRPDPPATLVYNDVVSVQRPMVNFPNVPPVCFTLPYAHQPGFPVSISPRIQQSIGSNNAYSLHDSPLAHQLISGRRLGLGDIIPMQTSDSMERELPGLETNFGQGTGFTLFSPEEISKQNTQYFSAYAVGAKSTPG